MYTCMDRTQNTPPSYADPGPHLPEHEQTRQHHAQTRLDQSSRLGGLAAIACVFLLELLARDELHRRGVHAVAQPSGPRACTRIHNSQLGFSFFLCAPSTCDTQLHLPHTHLTAQDACWRSKSPPSGYNSYVKPSQPHASIAQLLLRSIVLQP